MVEETKEKMDKLVEETKEKMDKQDYVDQRPSWDEYFMEIAKEVATRSTCPRKHVGSLIVRDKIILSTGYNGSIRGLPHCEEVGCMMENNHCVATVHAEANAIVQAARNGVNINGAAVYVTASPCWNCFKLIANSGIKKIFFGEFYRDEKIYEYSKKAGIELVDMTESMKTDCCEPEKEESDCCCN